MARHIPALVFASPRGLPRPQNLSGRVVVLDIAFAAQSGDSVSYDLVTKPFLDGLGDRLAAWVDHHDHDRHAQFAGDPRFTLRTKAQHGACPEIITPDLVRQAGPVDTVVCHLDLDGLYAAAKWILGGVEPYPGADRDAHAVDTRTREPGPVARAIDRALRARFRDDTLKRNVVIWLVEGMPDGPLKKTIYEAAREFAEKTRGTEPLAARYALRGRVAYVDARDYPDPFDKTDLLLLGQARADVAAVRDSGFITIAAAFDSGWDFVQLFGLEGGMPTRVSVPESREGEVLEIINRAPKPRS